MKANSDKSKQSNKATRRVLAGVLCGASVLSLVLSLVMPPISQAIANDAQTVSTEKTVMGGGSSSESTDVDNTGGDAENQNSDDAEGGETGDDALEAVPLSDDTEAEGAAQPADDGADDENAIALASVNANDNTELQDDVTGRFTNGGSYCLTSDAWSSEPITIKKDTKIDLAGHKLYYRVPKNDTDTFITVESGVLTIEDSAINLSDKPTTVNENNPGQPASVEWGGDNNGTPKSLTYYVTTSNPNADRLGTTETTTQHVVSGFGAIVAASDGGSVKQVISVEDGGTLNLNGGMITTPGDLAGDGHIIFAEGKSNETHVNINGGFITGANLNQQRGGWGGGLCVVGAKVTVNMTNGVIAANKAASGGGIYAEDATLNLSGGVISGNATYGNVYNNGGDIGGGYGGGVFTKGANVNISGSANITNNRVDSYINDGNIFNFGLLGGGGIASVNNGTLNMTGGSVTANYSHEAGGGIYAGFWNQAITFKMTGGTIAGNVAENAEGGGLRISTDTHATIDADGKIYITNNKTMTGSNSDEGRKGDWGGGGVFIQKGGKLNIVKALITNNEADGWGGGVGACPTGETIVSHSNGAAIYNNVDKGEHFSAGGHDQDKNQDNNADYITDDFKTAGHKDFFLVRKNDSANTVAVVLGKMLGGGSAGWKGTCDGKKITIDANGGAEAKYMFGLEAHPADDAKTAAQNAATTVISGNYSYTHGGGIMTNGDLIVGDVTEGLDVYPNMKLIATKVLKDANEQSTSLVGHEYKFKLLRQVGDTEPSWKDDDTFDMGDCSVTGEATVKPDGSITFDSGKDYSSGQYAFYLVEEPVSGENEIDTKFDKTIYKIEVTVGNSPGKTEYLMLIPIKHYTVEKVTVSKIGEEDSGFLPLKSGSYSVVPSADSTEATVTIGDGNANPTFTNRIVPYTSTGSWTPKATKVVEGGEMKEFTLEFADNENFTDAKTVKTTAGDEKSQTLSFDRIEYKLDQLDKLKTDSTGRGASNAFTYYVREQQPTSLFTNYKYDESVYRFDVTMTDQTDGTIVAAKATYTQIKNAEGEDIPEAEQKAVDYVPVKDESTGKDQSVPVFTNTYSTSLPLSGMSGVTLTYLAGAAVLCAAAAWMHIRRKANAKGGERRE